MLKGRENLRDCEDGRERSVDLAWAQYTEQPPADMLREEKTRLHPRPLQAPGEGPLILHGEGMTFS